MCLNFAKRNWIEPFYFHETHFVLLKKLRESLENKTLSKIMLRMQNLLRFSCSLFIATIDKTASLFMIATYIFFEYRVVCPVHTAQTHFPTYTVGPDQKCFYSLFTTLTSLTFHI